MPLPLEGYDRPLRGVVTAAIKGIKQATEEQNLGLVKLAAQIDIDLVDLLEGSIKKYVVKPCRPAGGVCGWKNYDGVRTL
jgi:hypothetical protein